MGIITAGFIGALALNHEPVSAFSNPSLPSSNRRPLSRTQHIMRAIPLLPTTPQILSHTHTLGSTRSKPLDYGRSSLSNFPASNHQTYSPNLEYLNSLSHRSVNDETDWATQTTPHRATLHKLAIEKGPSRVQTKKIESHIDATLASLAPLFPQDKALIQYRIKSFYSLLSKSLMTELKFILGQEGFNRLTASKTRSEDLKQLCAMHYDRLLASITNLSDIHDIIGVRIILADNDETACYDTLESIMHLDHFQDNFEFVDSRYRDYIKNEKPNHYQSLHAVLCSEDQCVEFQVRTMEMHVNAESGSASHDQFKELPDELMRHFLTIYEEQKQYGPAQADFIVG